MNRKKRKIILGIFAGALLAAAVFFFTFFQVKTVEVIGNTHCEADEIKELALSDFAAGNSVLASLLHKNTAVEDLPFVESYSITMTGRNAICISVREKKAVGCIPYLGNYVYFDRNGYFIESSRTRDKTVPYFDGIEVSEVILNEKLPIKDDTVLTTAVALATIFQKNDMVPEHIQFDENGQISLIYGSITVSLGDDTSLEEKMTKAIAILPKLSGKTGTLHLEGTAENSRPTFEAESEEDLTSEDWTGGYDEDGNYTGDGEYDQFGSYVGAKPKSDYDYALENWHGGYDSDGTYTGEGEYDADGNYTGPKPTEESIAANRDWKGGYMQDGSYTGYGQLDREGNYVGPNPYEDQEYTAEETTEETSGDSGEETTQETTGDSEEETTEETTGDSEEETAEETTGSF